MILFPLFRSLATIALRWYYRDVQAEGLERIPASGPLLFAVNHPNALVDALVVAAIVRRQFAITAKATLFENPVLRLLLTAGGAVPLRRATDEPQAAADPTRNQRTFEHVHRVLARGGAVLIFPEGISHDEPALAPLRTGAARMALSAQDGGVTGVTIVPIGLTFERKDAPRSRVLAQGGEPIHLDAWRRSTAGPRTAATDLTAEIDARLRAVTLNYASADDAARSTALASMFAALFSDVRSLSRPHRPLGLDYAIARRIEAVRARLADCPAEVLRRADAVQDRLAAFDARLRDLRILPDDIGIERSTRSGARFVLREGWILATAGPLALWGEINHWIPFRVARTVAVRTSPSAADPAMRTIVLGLVLVLLSYAAQGAAVWWLAGPWPALAYLVSLPMAAEINFRLRERLARARRRARAYLLFRRQPELHATLLAELTWLRSEARQLETELVGQDVGGEV